MNLVTSLLPQIPDFILALVALLTAVFLIAFVRKYRTSQEGLSAAIEGLLSKLGSHKGRDPRELDTFFSVQPLHNIWNEYSDTVHPMRLALAGPTPVVDYRTRLTQRRGPKPIKTTHTQRTTGLAHHREWQVKEKMVLVVTLRPQ